MTEADLNSQPLLWVADRFRWLVTNALYHPTREY